MDLTIILENLDRIAAILGLIIGLGGVTATWLGKIKIKQLLAGSREIVDLVDSYEKFNADHKWTVEEYQQFGRKSVLVVHRIKPLVEKLIKK